MVLQGVTRPILSDFRKFTQFFSPVLVWVHRQHGQQEAGVSRLQGHHVHEMRGPSKKKKRMKYVSMEIVLHCSNRSFFSGKRLTETSPARLLRHGRRPMTQTTKPRDWRSTWMSTESLQVSCLVFGQPRHCIHNFLVSLLQIPLWSLPRRLHALHLHPVQA